MSARLNYNSYSKEQIKRMVEVGNISSESIGKQINELVKIRASQINGCAFCLDMHIKEAKINGERELRLHHIAIWRESSLFSDKERAALEWTEEVTKLSAHGVNEELYARMLEQFSEKELSDLTFAIATINAWNRIAISFQTVPGSLDTLYGLTKAGLN